MILEKNNLQTEKEGYESSHDTMRPFFFLFFECNVAILGAS